MALVPNNTVVVQGFGVPTDAAFAPAPADGQAYLDENSGITYIRNKGVWVEEGLLALPQASTAGAVASSLSRAGALTDLGATGLFGGAAGGTISVVQLPLQVGQLVSKLTLYSGATAAGTPTHQWAGICDSALTVQAVSADGTNAALAADSAWVATMGTAYRIPKVGPWYAFAMWTATAVPSFMGATDGARTAVNAAVPIFAGTSSAAQTTAPALAATLGALTAVASAKFFVDVA